MTELFEFDWGVDQSGYEIEFVTPGPLLAAAGAEDRVERIRRKGGPLRYYRPMERPGLWRRCGETCLSPIGTLTFISEFGLFGEHDSESVDFIINTGRLLATIAERIDSRDRKGAASIFNDHAHPRLTATIVAGRKGAPEFKLVPLSLRAALHLQAGEAINGDRRFKRCRNCPEWFQVGTGAATARRDFCSTRCRVAWSRKPKLVAADAT